MNRVYEHKFKDYMSGKWRMITWWSFESEHFNVELRHYHYRPNGEYGGMSIPVQLRVSSQSGYRAGFKLEVIRSALVIATRVKDMDEETAMELEAATGYEPGIKGGAS